MWQGLSFPVRGAVPHTKAGWWQPSGPSPTFLPPQFSEPAWAQACREPPPTEGKGGLAGRSACGENPWPIENAAFVTSPLWHSHSIQTSSKRHRRISFGINIHAPSMHLLLYHVIWDSSDLNIPIPLPSRGGSPTTPQDSHNFLTRIQLLLSPWVPRSQDHLCFPLKEPRCEVQPLLRSAPKNPLTESWGWTMGLLWRFQKKDSTWPLASDIRSRIQWPPLTVLGRPEPPVTFIQLITDAHTLLFPNLAVAVVPLHISYNTIYHNYIL